MDVLSDVLDTMRLTSTAFGQARLAGAWGVRAPAADHYAFHVVVRGRCWFEVDGARPVEIEAGDVVVLAPGRGHVLRDSRKTPPRPLIEWITSGAFGPHTRSTVTDASAETHIVCGCFRFDTPINSVLLTALPVLIHTRDMANEAGLWLAQTIKLLAYESHIEQPGAATVTQRLCDALFVYILRNHLATLPPERASWLRALVDPQIGAALHLIHEAPGEAWTVAKLATRVGMSRSAFALRFAANVGESPMQYLIRWRVQKAAMMLRARGDTAMTEIATRVGYSSEAAFNKAFKRLIGQAPGAYRDAGAR